MPSDLIELIILALGAGFLIFKLYMTLGQRTGFEPNREASKEKVVEAFENTPEPQAHTTETIVDEPVAAHLKPLIDQILLLDSKFTVKTFLKGATQAFEIILEAFTKGNLPTLKDLSNAEVYEDFKTNIEERQKHGEVQDTTLIKVELVELTGGEVVGKAVRLTVTFLTEQIHVTRNLEGNIIDGNPKQIEELTDTWTFERIMTDRNPNWTLIKTMA